MKRLFPLLLLLLAFVGCSKSQNIVSNVDEREANLIIVFLDSRGIAAEKEKIVTTGIGAGASAGPTFNISVEEAQAMQAMAILNENGLPKKPGTNLLDLFAKQGLMSSEKEEEVRYQAGLAQTITNTIMMIDGVIDASVQLSFPQESSIPGEAAKGVVTAAVYVKHQGVIDDPNIHLENKIKRLVSGSVNGLDVNDVTVVSDRARLADVSISSAAEVGPGGREYVSIWSIVMSKGSAAKFRVLFFTILFIGLILAIALGWLIWKIYPSIKKRGLKELFKTTPILDERTVAPSEPPVEEHAPKE